MAKVRLFCIPFAGGSAAVYDRWTAHLSNDEFIEIQPVELPGRGKKMRQPLIGHVDEMVEHLYGCIKEQLDEPYALFGHSMGSLITYELCRRLEREGRPQPVHVFFSGRKAPQDDVVSRVVHDLPEEEFIEEVCKYGGSTRQAIENPTLRSLFLPILRSDFKLVETYRFNALNSILKCDISVIFAVDDPSTDLDNVMPWKELTVGKCHFDSFTGGHFFINEGIQEVVQFVQRRLAMTIANQR